MLDLGGEKMDTSRSPHVAMSLRLKPSTGKLLDQLSEKMGLNKTSVITVSLRELAKREGIEVKEGNEDNDAN